MVGRDLKSLCEIDQESAWGLRFCVLVVGDDALRDADFLGEIGLSEAAALADLGEPFTEAFEGSFFHWDLCEEFQKYLRIVGATSKTG